jgi:hypothetical protein
MTASPMPLEQREQEGPLDLPQTGRRNPHVAAQEIAEGRGTGLDRADQPMVDAEHERDGAARHTGHDVGHPHEEPSDDVETDRAHEEQTYRSQRARGSHPRPARRAKITGCLPTS